MDFDWICQWFVPCAIGSTLGIALRSTPLISSRDTLRKVHGQGWVRRVALRNAWVGYIVAFLTVGIVQGIPQSAQLAALAFVISLAPAFGFDLIRSLVGGAANATLNEATEIVNNNDDLRASNKNLQDSLGEDPKNNRPKL